jgi:GcrA cell cycle regulator
MQSLWPEEHSKALREYLERGWSFSETANAINERFNTAYTRNAAIGRAKRMGLSGAVQSGRSVRPKSHERASPTRLVKLRARALAEARPRPEVFERAAALNLRCVGIVPRHLSLIELEDGDCRYPYGGDVEGEVITFCGHPRREGTSYCNSHFHLTSSHPADDPASVSRRSAGRVALRLVEAA